MKICLVFLMFPLEKFVILKGLIRGNSGYFPSLFSREVLMVLLQETRRVSFFVWCVKFLLDKFLTLGPEKDSHFPNMGDVLTVCEGFFPSVCQAKEKLPLLVAGCCSEPRSQLGS